MSTWRWVDCKLNYISKSIGVQLDVGLGRDVGRCAKQMEIRSKHGWWGVEGFKAGVKTCELKHAEIEVNCTAVISVAEN